MAAAKKDKENTIDSFLLPRENSILVGHDAAEQEFVSAWNSGRCAHAWLISGTKGIGKATLAYRIARFVLAGGDLQSAAEDKAPPVSADGGLFGDELPMDNMPTEEGGESNNSALQMDENFPLFKRIASGGHADLTVIERTVNEKTNKMRTEIVVDGIRNLSETFYMTSAEGGWKVAIVDSADEMNKNSANALLKLLEEPPARSLIILLSHNPGKLLPTIKSRCRKLGLKPLSSDNVELLLDKYLNSAEKAKAVNEDDIKKLAELSDGSIGKAIEIYKNGGLALYSEMTQLLSSANDKKQYPAKVNSFSDKISKTDDSFDTFFDLLLSDLSRNIIRFSKDSSLNNYAINKNIDIWQDIKKIWDKTKEVNMDKKQSIMDALFLLEKV
jgi:DNA polymerase-3 subunit delta'